MSSQTIPPSRKALWIAMSELWLDNELGDSDIDLIADAVRASRLGEAELDAIFAYELAPFLGPNHLSVAGEWAGFDPDWVCEEAAKRYGRPRWRDRIAARLGITTFGARPEWERVKERVFG